MFTNIAVKFCKELIQSQFQIPSLEGNREKICEQTKFITLFKEEGPIFYICSLVNSAQIEVKEYENVIDLYLEKMYTIFSQNHFNHIICVSILISEHREELLYKFIEEKDFISKEKVHHIWWYGCEDTKEIYVKKGQPDKILNLQKVLQKALHAQFAEETDNLEIPKEKYNTYYEQGQEKEKICYITASLFAVNAIIFVGMFITGTNHFFVNAFGNETYMVLKEHQYYRLVTSIFLHGSFIHLISNGVYLYFFGSKLEIILGKTNFILLYFLSGIFSSITSIFFTKNLSIGASGAVYGLIGAALVYCRIKGTDKIGISYFTILTIAVIGIIYGFSLPQIDNFGHIGGFITGCFLAWLIEKPKGQ